MTPSKDRLRPLARDFYLRDTLEVAHDLLGRLLISDFRGQKLAGRIVEAEAYIGEDDPACHARFGKTKRNGVMYGIGGFSYVYFIYGMYNMFNVVCETEGFPAAVLIRALEPVHGLDTMCELRGCKDVREFTSGPGKLCQALGIDTTHSGIDLTGDRIYIAEDMDQEFEVERSGRIGIKEGTDRLWRFYMKGNDFVSVQ